MSSNNQSRPIMGVGVLIWRDKTLLLGKRLLAFQEKKQNFCWQFPGGHLEVGESIVECAQREVCEETGLDVKAMRNLGFTNQTFSMRGRQYITLLVSCEYKSGEAQKLEPEKCADWQWFDYRQLPAPLFEPISLFLAQYSLVQSSRELQTNLPAVDLYAMHQASRVLSDTPSNEHK